MGPVLGLSWGRDPRLECVCVPRIRLISRACDLWGQPEAPRLGQRPQNTLLFAAVCSSNVSRQGASRGLNSKSPCAGPTSEGSGMRLRTDRDRGQHVCSLLWAQTRPWYRPQTRMQTLRRSQAPGLRPCRQQPGRVNPAQALGEGTHCSEFPHL